MKISRRNKSTHIVKYLFAFILLFSLVFPCYSCSAPDTTDEQNDKSFIWKISSDDSFVYLLGSVHIASPDIYPLDSSIENAFEISDKLVVETNVNEVGPITTLLLLEKYGTYPAGEGLRENLPESLYKQLEDRFREMGIPISTMNDYRPWVIVSSVEGLVMVDNDYSAEYGIDLHFINSAVDRDMEILELEEAKYLFELMSELPDELMVLILEMSFEEPDLDDYIDYVGYMFALWEKGDTEGIAELLFEDLYDEPALAPFYEVLYSQRNHNMMIEIEEYLADEYTYFIVVGAGHLVGEEGLLNLLDEAGYTIEQL